MSEDAFGRYELAVQLANEGRLELAERLLPAAIEACEDEQPMLLLSADRPPELLACGANQATTQRGLFADHARAVLELPADAADRHAWDVGRRAAAAGHH